MRVQTNIVRTLGMVSTMMSDLSKIRIPNAAATKAKIKSLKTRSILRHLSAHYFNVVDFELFLDPFNDLLPTLNAESDALEPRVLEPVSTTKTMRVQRQAGFLVQIEEEVGLIYFFSHHSPLD